MNICPVCGESPSLYDKMIIRLDDEKIRVEISGHIKCMENLSNQIDKHKEIWKNKKGNKNRVMPVQTLLKMLELNLNNYLI